nr:MAG TPA: hypothetical protein [Caudoviricetes sp.]
MPRQLDSDPNHHPYPQRVGFFLVVHFTAPIMN